MSNERTIAAHRLCIEGDTVLTRYVGVPEYEHVQEIHRHFNGVLAEYGTLFIINDMSRSGIPSTRTRRWIAEWAQHHPVSGIVNIGASLPVRALQSLILRATSLLGKQAMITPVNCADETEAFAWIARRRRLI
jgi:hypothetical protein